MDDATQIKVRDLKLKILKVERELAATLHNANLASALRTGHAGQMAKAAERDRIRLEARLEELKAKLDTLTGPALAAEEKATAVETPVAEKKPAGGKAPATEKAAKKAASAKAPAADKPKKAPSKKKAD